MRNWKNVTKEQGGLGAKDPTDHSIALLGKWLWKALNSSDSDRVHLLRDRIYRRKLQRLDGRSIIGALAFWKGVWRSSGSSRCGVKFCCGDGKNVRFCLDIWIRDATLR